MCAAWPQGPAHQKRALLIRARVLNRNGAQAGAWREKKGVFRVHDVGRRGHASSAAWAALDCANAEHRETGAFRASEAGVDHQLHQHFFPGEASHHYGRAVGVGCLEILGVHGIHSRQITAVGHVD